MPGMTLRGDRLLRYAEDSERPLAEVAAVNILLVLLGFWALISSRTDRSSLVSSVLLLIVGGEILSGIALLFSPKGRVWGRALLFGFLLTVALPLLLVGICILTYSLPGEWH
jgi:hypothetical protein